MNGIIKSFDYAAAGLKKPDATYVERIAKEIDRKKRYVEETAVEAAIHIGHELVDARRKFEADGDRVFCRWMTERCGIPKSTGYRFIAAFEAFGNCPTVGQIDLSAIHLLSGDKCPEEVTLAAIERSKSERITKAAAAAMLEAATVEADDDPAPPAPTIAVPTPRNEDLPTLKSLRGAWKDTDAEEPTDDPAEPEAMDGRMDSEATTDGTDEEGATEGRFLTEARRAVLDVWGQNPHATKAEVCSSLDGIRAEIWETFQ